MSIRNAAAASITTDHVGFFWENGYAIVRGVFGRDEIAELAAGFDQAKAEGMRHPSSFRHGNMMYRIEHDANLGRIPSFLLWPSYSNPLFARYRVDRRFLDILDPLIGNDLKQIVNQLTWKPPGSARITYSFHQDCRFRQPVSAFRELATSYVQTAIAIDPHHPENGCLRVLPGSHKRGDLRLGLSHHVFGADSDERMLAEAGLDPAGLVDILLAPGDVALWGPYMVHGSGPNRSAIDRRFYVNGYVIAQNCDRGEWAFRGGEPCPLGEPVLVQYEDLFVRPEPHYIDGSPPTPTPR